MFFGKKIQANRIFTHKKIAGTNCRIDNLFLNGLIFCLLFRIYLKMFINHKSQRFFIQFFCWDIFFSKKEVKITFLNLLLEIK